MAEMKATKTIKVSGLMTIVWLFIGFLFAFFTYGLDWVKALGFLGYAIVWIVIMYATMIPFGGIVFYILGLVFWNAPLMLFFTISPSWLTTLTVILFGVLGIFSYVLMTLAVIIFIYSKE